MINITEFQIILKRPESSTLDFKATMYNFTDDKELVSTSKFVKDVISFTNTIRTETAYIIFGVKEKEDGLKDLLGLAKHTDDSLLQAKVKDKVFPAPSFYYYEFKYQEKLYGILEFSVIKYIMPVTPSVKLKGLEVGKAYYRQGTTNAEATTIESIRINDWLKSLPEISHIHNLYDETAKLIKALTLGNENISVILTDILSMARKHKIADLIAFCVNELGGIKSETARANQENFMYRAQTIFISGDRISINPLYNATDTQRLIRQQMEQSKDFYRYKMLFTQSVYEIEKALEHPDSLGTVDMSSKDVFPETNSEYRVQGYIFPDVFVNVYKSIRQKAIDKLIQID